MLNVVKQTNILHKKGIIEFDPLFDGYGTDGVRYSISPINGSIVEAVKTVAEMGTNTNTLNNLEWKSELNKSNSINRTCSIQDVTIEDGDTDPFGDGSLAILCPLSSDSVDLLGNHNGLWNGTEAYSNGLASFDATNNIEFGDVGITPSNGVFISFDMQPNYIVNYLNPFTTNKNGLNNAIRLEINSSANLMLYIGNSASVDSFIVKSGVLRNVKMSIAISIGNGNVDVYVDGSLAVSGQVNYLPTSMPNVEVGGGFNSDAQRQFNGLIGNLSIYGRYVDQTEADNLLNNNIVSKLTCTDTIVPDGLCTLTTSTTTDIDQDIFGDGSLVSGHILNGDLSGVPIPLSNADSLVPSYIDSTRILGKKVYDVPPAVDKKIFDDITDSVGIKTISCWVYIDQSKTEPLNSYLFDNRVSSTAYIILPFDSNLINFIGCSVEINGVSVSRLSSISEYIGEWIHLKIVFDSPRPIMTYFQYSGTVGTGVNYSFQGQVSDVISFNRVLTQEEIDIVSSGNINGSIVETESLCTEDTVVRKPYYRGVFPDSTTAGTSWSVIKTWDEFIKSPGDVVDLAYRMPCRNDNASWGGGYLNIAYSIDSGATWVNFFDSGYDASMVSGGDGISSISGSLIVDIQEVTDSEKVMFRYSAKSYGGTLSINASHGITASLNGDLFGGSFTQINLKVIN